MTDKKNGGFHKGMRAFALGSTIAIQFAVATLVGLAGGRFLDAHFGTEPWLMLVGLFAGLAAAILSVFRLISRWFT